MKCTHCNKNEANTRVKTIINGNKEEMYLCEGCAKELGVFDEFKNFSIDNMFGNYIKNFDEGFNSLMGIDRCSYCGTSLNEIFENGRVGCSHCYDKFEDRLKPTIEKIHGNTHHIGKSLSYVVEDNNEIEELKSKLKQAVAEQRFEDAVILRDKIKEMQKESQNG